MLERDKYEPDFCINHFPNYSMEEYVVSLAGPYAFRRLLTNTDEFAKKMEFRNNMLFGTLVLSTLPVFLHKKIYWLRNYTSKKSRILWGLLWVLVPVNISAMYFQRDS